MIQPIILWSDMIFFILIGSTSFFAVQLYRQAHWRAACLRVLHHRLGMATFLILLAYFSIAFLDSLHFQMPGELKTVSVLDSLLAPLGEHTEKTYSAPFASHLLNKEMQLRPNGSTFYGYLRLEYGAAQLAHPAEERAALIGRLSAKGALHALLIWGSLAVSLVLFYRLRKPTLLTGMPWGVFLGVLGMIVLIACISSEWSTCYHILGTDRVGNDVFYVALKSIRTNLLIGVLALGVLLPFAVFLGMAAGYFRGWIDDVIQYLYTTLNSIPDVLLIVAAVLALQIFIASHAHLFHTLSLRADVRLLALCAILGMTSWTGLCRVLRAETLKLREMEYVRAAKVLGTSPLTILFRHIMPNLMHLIIISLVLDFSGLILTEAVLTYVGVGVDPTTPSWGNMINAARLEMAREPVVWWPLLTAFIFMFCLVMAANVFADVLRDAFDPKN